MARRRRCAPIVLLAGTLLFAGTVTAAHAATTANSALVVDQAHSVPFNPYEGLGTTIDSFDAVQGMTHQLKNGDTDQAGNTPGRRPVPGFDDDLFTPQEALSAGNIAHLASSGLRPLSYRLVTELREETWHWSPDGTFSAGAKGGYWTSTGTATSPAVNESYGYDIAHGGTSLPGGETAYVSRLDDGDTGTYWKSNPYLDERYTHESDTLHPQWAVVDLGKRTSINQVTIKWGDPFAVSYRVQSWHPDSGTTSPFDDPGSGHWADLPGGAVQQGTGGTATLPVGATKAQFVRVLMGPSSGTCANGESSDVRNCTGYAVRELYVGHTSGGTLTDAVKHGNETVQSATYVSSSDPAEDTSSVRQFDQPGIDEVYDSGANQGLPMMVPVPVLYSTPENAVALLRYLEAKGHKIRSVEIGEEADGQYMPPEDYAALWSQWAVAIHAFDPALALGGPGLQDSTAASWNDNDKANTDFGTRMIAYLRSHGRLGDLRFYSFEQYPIFDSNGPAGDYKLLLNEPKRSAAVLAQLRATIPDGIPLYCTEQSAYGDDVQSGLWQADFNAAMFTDGLAGNFNYQALPQHLFGDGLASNLFTADAKGQWTGNTSIYYASSMLGNQWLQPVNAAQDLHPVQVPAIKDSSGNQLVTAYAVRRPDQTWALLVINKSTTTSYSAPLDIGGTGLTGTVDAYSWGKAQYTWHDNGNNGYASPNGGPVHTTIAARSTTSYTFPSFSITVIRGTAG